MVRMDFARRAPLTSDSFVLAHTTAAKHHPIVGRQTPIHTYPL